MRVNAQVVIKEKVEISPQNHFDGGPVHPDTTLLDKENLARLTENKIVAPNNAQSTLLMPFYGKVKVEVIYSDAAASARISLEIRQPEYQMLCEYANKNIGFTSTSDNYNEGTPVEFGIDWYFNDWGTIYQGKEAGVITTQISPTEYTMSFEDSGIDWDYNDLIISVKFLPVDIVITLNPPVIFPGDTANIIIKNRLADGILIDFPPEQKFEVGMLDGCIYGHVVAGSDTGAYLNNVQQPIYFIADTGAVDSGSVLLRVGIVEETPLNKTSTQTEIQSNYCFSGNFVSQDYSEASMTVDNPLYIIYPTILTVERITEEPKMPTVVCKASLKKFYPGLIKYEWKYIVNKTYERRTVSSKQICERISKSRDFRTPVQVDTLNGLSLLLKTVGFLALYR
ncbi:MAG: hypothetical protein WAV89_03340 [Ignavibacteriaceae bacterium]